MRLFTPKKSLRSASTKKSQSGSVLILVVSLLVMLAMMGTAYIATARIDRLQSIATDIQTKQDSPWQDDQADQVRSIIISNDVFGAIPAPPALPPFRPAGVPTAYTHIETPAYDPANPTWKFDGWLADRLPQLNTAADPATQNRPYWRYVSRLPDTSYYDIQNSATLIFLNTDTAGSTWKPYASPAEGLMPTSIVLDPTHLNGTPMVVPAFQRFDTSTGLVAGTPFIAADADGDGIADSLLYQIPGATGIGGTTIWAGVRIIDNNSAVNASTAYSKISDFNLAGAQTDAVGAALTTQQNLGFFPSHIGLQEILSGTAANQANEMASWNGFRLAGLPVTPTNNVFSDPTGVLRTDVNYITKGDALYTGLTRRINNPGRTNAGLAQKFGYAGGDQQYIGYGFGLINPALNSNPSLLPITAPAKIEQLLNATPGTLNPTSAYTLAINWVKKPQNQWVQYPANRAQYWYGYNFNRTGAALAGTDWDTTPAAYVPASAVGCVRPLIVMSNPVSNAIKAHKSTLNVTGLPVVASTAAHTDGMLAYSATANPTKCSINTANFDELWRAYWNVMCDDTNPDAIPATSGTIFSHTSRSGTTWGTYAQLLIRAAVAAVNAEDLRSNGNGSQDISIRDITIPDSAGTLKVRVYGTKRQPYITNVNFNAAGDSADITWIDPTGGPISLADCRFYRRRVVGGFVTMTPLGATTFTISGGGGMTLAMTPPNDLANGDELVLTRDQLAAGGSGVYVPIDQAPVTLGGTYTRTGGWNAVKGGASGGATSPIQIQNLGWPGPSSVAAKTFPFGGFARLGDILQVPFIGAYQVSNAASQILEVNSITMDCAYADQSAGAAEQVGRFCPLRSADPTFAGSDVYAWSSDVFDYFTTIQNQNDDYLPGIPNAATKVTSAGVLASPVANGGAGSANGGAEDTLSSAQGLININTAPVEVLNTLPFSTTPATNLVIAQAIVAYRNSNGPFRNIFDLNRVPGFQDATLPSGTIATWNPNSNDGDFSDTPVGTADGVIGDFEARFLTLARVSNLVSTRSDSFTVYIVIQSWKYAGTPAAQFVSQRRAGFIVDRTQVMPSSRTPTSVGIQY